MKRSAIILLAILGCAFTAQPANAQWRKIADSRRPSGTTWSNFGENNIFVTTLDTLSHVIVNNDVIHDTTINLQSLDRNYFGMNIDPAHDTITHSHWNLVDTNQLNAINIAYSKPMYTSDTLISLPGWANECGSSYAVPPKKKDLPLAFVPPDTCTNMYYEAQEYQTERNYKKEFDTAKHFIETCPFNSNAPQAFSIMTDAVGGYGSPWPDMWGSYQKWLEAVLYLNTVNPNYFCSDIAQMGFASTNTDNQDTIIAHTNRTLALIKWIIDSTKCYWSSEVKSYDELRASQKYYWQTHDTTKPLDTTLPPWHSLGLDTILAKRLQYQGVAPRTDDFDKFVTSFGVSENPFTKQTELRFDVSKMAYVGVEVFDVMGRVMYGDDGGKIYPAGGYRVPVDLSADASGAYYLRITLGTGEVRTIKLVKE